MAFRNTRSLHSDFMLKLFSRRFEWNMKRKSRHTLLLTTGFAAGMLALASFSRLYSIDASERLEYLIGWQGEYAQDFRRLGHPPLNLNLPPHLRTDMKSYLDLPETVIPVPPAWDDLHPYVRVRYHDLFLEKPFDEHLMDTSKTFFYIAPWGGVPSIETSDQYILFRNDLLDKAEQGVLFSQHAARKKKTPQTEPAETAA
ncbi:hypothetical protein DIPPA_28133 [Diplonema papillatum]|nr:hypothetical protein DIPPA_28133 [Diplonema papillatum]|eukprot:gene7803-11993_t